MKTEFRNHRFFIVSILMLFFIFSCQSFNEDSNLSSNMVGQGTAWKFPDCRMQDLDGVEPSSVATNYVVFQKVTHSPKGALNLIFTDEIGEEFTLKVDRPQVDEKFRKVWWGKGILANAVELDKHPVVVGYELELDEKEKVTSEKIFTKRIVPTEYLEENVKNSFEINKYSANGDAIGLVIMQLEDEPSLDFEVTRACGKGFGFEGPTARQHAKEGQFDLEMMVKI